MMVDQKSPPKPAKGKQSDFWLEVRHWLTAALIAGGVIAGGTLIVNLQARELSSRQQYELLQTGSTMRARLMRELNGVLYLTSGLKSYLTVRHSQLQRDEVEGILAWLYNDAQHVRNFGIAIGHTLTYIHPLRGNEKAIGLYYPNVPEQWRDVQRAIASEKPLLIGPLKLVQGGNGLIYRVPVFIKGKYWGLVSSVIDSDALLRSALAENTTNELVYALRGTNGEGMLGDVFWGDGAVFSKPGTQLIDIEVPGGKWVLGLRNDTQN